MTGPPNGVVHLVEVEGRLLWSGYHASGDPTMGRGGSGRGNTAPRHPYAARIDMGCPEERYHIGPDDDRLHLLRDGRYIDFTPEALLLAARRGMFGLRLL